MEQNKFSINDYLMAQRSSHTSEYPVAKRIVCKDGFSLSVQANQAAYCYPRKTIGPWYEVEVGFPSAKPELIMSYAEDQENPTETVYGYVPVDLVEQLIYLHGGPDDETMKVVNKASL